MSILQQVMKEYGVSEISEPLTDKTDKRASVSSVSEWSEGFESKNNVLGIASDAELKDALEDDWDEVSNDRAQLEVARMWVTEAKQVASGIIPKRYKQTSNCKYCGPVLVVEGYPKNANNCPWCFNRVKELPIPKENR